MIDELSCPVILEKDTHTYRHRDGGVYSSVSAVRKNVGNPFNKEEIAYVMAVSYWKKTEKAFDKKDIVDKQRMILNEWDEKNQYSRDKGTFVDDVISNFLLYGRITEPKIEPLLNAIWKLMAGYSRRIVKPIVWSDDHEVAGEIDTACERRSKNIVDFYDYKGCIFKQVEYASKNNKFLKEPLAHLEDCSYNDYSLQLSVYALLAEICYKVKPGKLTVIQFFDNEWTKYRLIPVPYMKYEAWSLLELHKRNHQTNF